MKQLLVLITLMSSLIIPSVAHAEWTRVFDDWYVDYERVRQKNNKNYLVWMLLNFTDHGSATFLLEFDCKALGTKLLQITGYEQPFASGNVTQKKGPNKNWQYAEPNTTIEKQNTKICKKLD